MTTPMGNMVYEEVQSVGILRFPAFSEIPWIRHAFSTRKGGVSPEPYASMNLNFGRGDPDENVRQNFHIFCRAAGFAPESLTASAQTHSTEIRRVTGRDAGNGIWRPKDRTGVDGLITNDPAVTLVTYYADCTPLFFVDIKHQAVGLAHSGWRGTAARMGAVMVHRMREEFGTEPQDLLAAVGPAIGPCCYEVDEPVAQEFAKMNDLSPSTFLTEKGEGKYMLNLWEANRRILFSTGIPSSSISVAELCTQCHRDLLWSHRATKGLRGGMAAMLGIRKEEEL